MPTAQEQMQALSEAGYPPEKIQAWKDERITALKQAGYSDAKIAEWAGDENPHFAETLRAHVEENFGKALAGVDSATVGTPNPKTFPSWAKALDAGLGFSVPGLLATQKVPEGLAEDAGLADRIAFGAGQLAGDLPVMLAGAALGGGPASPVTATAGAFALPAATRRVLLEAYGKGRIQTPQRFAEVLGSTLLDAGKNYVTGAATGAVGAVGEAGAALANVPKAAVTAAEIGTMTTVASALEGHLPKPMDFVDGAILLGGLKVSMSVAAKLKHIYAQTGKLPADVVKDAQTDPTIREDLLSNNVDTPRAYLQLEAGEPVQSTEQARQAQFQQAIAEWKPQEAAVAAGGGAAPPGPPTPPEAARPAGAPMPPDEALAKVLSRISVGEETPQAKSNLDLSRGERLYTDLVDKANPLRIVVDKMAEGADLPTLEDAYKLVRLLPGSAAKAEHFLKYGPFDYETFEKTGGESFRKIVRDLGEEGVDQFRAYVTALHSIEIERGLHGRGLGMETGVDQQAAEAVVRNLHQKMDPIRQRLQDYQDGVLDYYQKSGLISHDEAEVYRAMNRAYVPFHRVLENPVQDGPVVKTRHTVQQIIREFQGGHEKIVDPLETIVKNTYMLTAMAERNRAARAFVELAEKSPVGSKFAVRVDAPRLAKGEKPAPGQTYARVEKEGELGSGAPQLSAEQHRDLVRAFESGVLTKEQGEQLDALFESKAKARYTPTAKNEITVFRNGVRERWRVDPEIYDVFASSSADQIGQIQKILQGMSGLLRAGTILTPEYMGRNLIRDQFEATINSNVGYRLGIEAVRGAFSLYGKGDAYQEWLRSGAPMSSIVSSDRGHLQLRLEELLRDPSYQESVRNVLRHPIEAMRSLSEMSDQITRISIVQRARQKGMDLPSAGFESREGTLDFNRIGARTQAVNRISAFWNPQVQGLDKAYRMLRDHPVRTAVLGAASITLPSILLYLSNRDEEGYDEIPRWQRDAYWIWPSKSQKAKGPFQIEAAGRTWNRFPKPQVFGTLFGAMPERATEWLLDHHLGKDSKAARGLVSTVLRNSVPIPIPTAATPVVEGYFNQSLFTGRPVIPASREKMLPEYQYQPYTTELAKKVGKVIAMLPGMKTSEVASPALIENAIHGWTGGLGVYALQAANLALQKSHLLPETPQPALQPADLPILRGFSVRFPSAGAESIQEFYERSTLSEQYRSTVRGLVQEGDLENAQREAMAAGGLLVDQTKRLRTMSQISALTRALWRDPTMTPEEKRHQIDALLLFEAEVAKQGNALYDAMEKAAAEPSAVGTEPGGAP